MKPNFKYNNGAGAVLCSVCKVIIDEGLSQEEAVAFYNTPSRNRCMACNQKAKAEKND